MKPATPLLVPPTHHDTRRSLEDLERAIEHASHLLPSQGPITVFVHHNTLHALEDEPFEQAVSTGTRLYGCRPFMPEERYREEVQHGRIRPEDLAAVLADDLGAAADEPIGFAGTRLELRLAMLEHPLRFGSDAEIRWLIAETDALHRFRAEALVSHRYQSMDDTQRWVMRDLRNGNTDGAPYVKEALATLRRQFGEPSVTSWSTSAWETATLQLLWRVCRHGVRVLDRTAPGPRSTRDRDEAPRVVDGDIDTPDDMLVRFCAAFLDQDFANWPLPDRDKGFFEAFVKLYAESRRVGGWQLALPTELRRIRNAGLTALESVAESLDLLGIEPPEREEFIVRTLLAQRGWSGMIWQMETNAEWTVHPAPRGTLVGYLAVRLILERVAGRHLDGVRTSPDGRERASLEQRAFIVFQLAQVRGWAPSILARLSAEEWSTLVSEIESFSSLERRRIFHLAYERKYRNKTLDAVLVHCRRTGSATSEPPAYQVTACIDEREESFRRHLEEVDPGCETFGTAGFYGVAMYYRGAAEAHFRPLCPVNVKPTHYVEEESVYSFEESSRLRAEARRALGQAAHQVHVGTRTFLGGVATALLGSLATVPLILRVLFPRTVARARRSLGRIVKPAATRLRLEAFPGASDPDGQRGYTVDEMAGVVESVLRGMGLTRGFAKLVVVVGHGSSSLNNPHEAAHDCGACGGGRGGPNARAFAEMANDDRVRRILAEHGLEIPDDVHFVGAYHNTCDDGMTYYDLDALPLSHRERFERARAALDEARKRNAHERCRRFHSAALSISAEEALQHVEGRSEDLSQVRPEYGHATNALCFVGHREWSRDLFLDRRAFLTSYDPTQDDEESTILQKLLSAVIPVCAGISLEYYFSFVDPRGYGCATKLPHNITSLLGVMDGAASDLRPGLPWQMVEIHEPVRILFLIETTPQAMQRVIDANPTIAQLVHNRWVQLATLDRSGPTAHVFHDGRFESYVPEDHSLATAKSSLAWYRGQRAHLGFATISSVEDDPEHENVDGRLA